MTRRLELRDAFWLWDAYFALGFAVTGGLVLFAFPAPSALERYGTAVALLATFAWYLAVGRKEVIRDNQGRRAMVFVAGVIVLFAVQVAFQPRMTMGWFAALPMVFMASPLRVALPAVGV
ncbi:MAG: hypothetical protein ACRDQF_18970, partial [Thermocrispum sp.]